MKISLEWLRQYVDYQDGPERLEEILRNVGFEIDGREQVGDDWMLDVEITSNRPDCLGHIGLAREVAAVTGATVKIPEVTLAEQGAAVSQRCSVANEAPDLCGRYTARFIDGVQVGASPDWMVRRLATVGMRSINNVVDVTNYVLMEVGQPLHSFDFGKLAEGRIVVRRARSGERLVAIDESKLELTDDMLVIADGNEPVAMAGIMGGLASEVSDGTQAVVLESAHFAPLSIRHSSRALTLSSESSFRFERNVDIVTVDWASRRAAGLLAELAGGKVAPGLIDLWGASEWQAKKVDMRLSRMRALLGIEVEVGLVMSIFQSLGLEPAREGEDVIRCTIPSWRGDLSREVDLIEEVIRIYGYGQVPTETKIHITVTTSDQNQRTREAVAQVLSGCGFYEAVSVGFIEDRYWPLFGEEGFEPLRVKDMSRRSNNALRHSLLPSLLMARKRNQDAGNAWCDLYELAATHRAARDQDGPAAETVMLGLVTDGNFRDLRGVVEAMVAGLDRQAEVICRECELVWAASGCAAELYVGEQMIGVIGHASDEVNKVFDLTGDVCLAEMRFEELLKLEGRIAGLQPIPRFPGITRDLSLVLAESTSWEQIKASVTKSGGDDLRDVEFVDVYRGKGIASESKCITLSMEFRRVEGTLTHEEVDKEQERILAELQESLGARLRS